MTQKLQSVTTYIIIILVVGIFAYLITGFGNELKSSENSKLSNSSLEYIDEINGGGKNAGYNDSYFGDDIGKVSDLGGNDNKNEFSLDFSFGDKTGTKLQRSVYLATNIPEFIFMDIFKLTSLQWLMDMLDWTLNILIFIAFVNWIRGRLS